MAADEESYAVVPRDFDIWGHFARIMYKRRKLFVDPSGISHLEAEPWEPPCELVEMTETYVARLEIPGVEKKSITLTVDNNKTLRVRGNKVRPGEPEIGAVTPPPQEEARRKAQQPVVHFCDIVYGFWNRTIELPGDVAVENISAVCENGVLTVVLPKTKVHTSTVIPVL